MQSSGKTHLENMCTPLKYSFLLLFISPALKNGSITIRAHALEQIWSTLWAGYESCMDA